MVAKVGEDAGQLFGQLLIGRRQIVQPLEISGGALLVVEHARAKICTTTKQLTHQRTVVDLLERAAERRFDPPVIADFCTERLEKLQGRVVDVSDERIAQPLESHFDVMELSLRDHRSTTQQGTPRTATVP